MVRVAMLLVSVLVVAQVFPSCGGENTEVVGWVEAKHVEGAGHVYWIQINSTEYDVPGYFWQQVQIGDLVKWDGLTWTIVKKANQPPS